MGVLSDHILAYHCGDQTWFVDGECCLVGEVAWPIQQGGQGETTAS